MPLLSVPDRLVTLGAQCRDLLHGILHGSAIHGFVEVPAMTRLLGIPSGARVLVLGCGSGVALVSLARLCRPSRITGIDIDRGLLSEAALRLRSGRISGQLVQSDIRAMPFADRSFNVVIDFGTCYHVAGAQRALEEVDRVLDTGGVFAHETLAAQFMAHPTIASRKLPWEGAPSLAPAHGAVLWAIRRKR